MSRWKFFLTGLVLILAVVWTAVAASPDKDLHIVACDVGQGDAILIYQGTNQLLIDGGPNNKIIDCLGRYMPFWDKKIEIVVMTHPQKDHFGGLVDVFQNYQVDYFLTSRLKSSSQDFQALENALGGSGATTLQAHSGQKLRAGLMYLDVVWPSQAIQNEIEDDNITTNHDPNDFSVIVNLTYRNFTALFTGDIGPEELDEVLATGKIKDVDYLKIPHHGSKNGLTQNLLDLTTPEIAVISVGKNQWGHPHQEVLGMLDVAGIDFYRTDQIGDVQVVTDGKNYWVDK